jgi:hypothetical protein
LRTDEQLLQQLRDFVKSHGKATQVMLAADPSMATGGTYGARFGSFSRALQLIKTEPPEDFPEIERRARIKTWLQDEFARTLAVNNVQSRRSHGFFISSQHPPVLLDVARCFALADGQLRWEIRYPLTRNEGLRCITVRLHPDNKLPMDYVFIPCLPRAIQRWRFSEERIQRLASIHKSLDEAVSLFLQDSSRYAKQNTPTA